MLAINFRFATAFGSGLLAAVNPCGFVLLPTYLIYFLGMENLRPGAERASIPRALKVSLAVSGGFMAVFLLIGTITKLTTTWFISEPGPYLSLGIGVLLVALGIAMLFGYRLPFTTPKLDIGQRDRSVRSMFVFGVAFAIASLGCALPPFLGTLSSFSSNGVATGLIAVALYGVGMALVVVGLTVSLAMANTALLKVLRKGMAWFEHLAGAFVLLTGLYLCWFWISDLREDFDNGVLTTGLGWQQRVERFVAEHQTPIAALAGMLVVAAVGLSLSRRRREPVT